MKALAKLGFTQSYTYFTWRNTKSGARRVSDRADADRDARVLSAATSSPTRPDILPRILQFGGRPAFRMRLVLAATLSSVYGIYNGFELAENRPRGDAGTTEYYQDSEMYQHKVWDWERPGQHRRRRHAHQSHPPREPGAAPVRQPALLRRRQRPAAGLRQGHARRIERHRCAWSISTRSGHSRAGSTCRSRSWGITAISRTWCTIC